MELFISKAAELQPAFIIYSGSFLICSLTHLVKLFLQFLLDYWYSIYHSYLFHFVSAVLDCVPHMVGNYPDSAL